MAQVADFTFTRSVEDGGLTLNFIRYRPDSQPRGVPHNARRVALFAMHAVGSREYCRTVCTTFCVSSRSSYLLHRQGGMARDRRGGFTILRTPHPQHTEKLRVVADLADTCGFGPVRRFALRMLRFAVICGYAFQYKPSL